MECDVVKEYLDSYADGELQADKVQTVGNHVERCADCTAYVENQRQLRQSLSRAFGLARPAEHLRDRVMLAVQEGDVSAGPLGRTRFQRLSWPIGIAAVIALYVMLPTAKLDGPTGPSSGQLQPVQFVHSVVGRHNGCLMLGAEHHRADLPRSLAGIERLLTAELAFQVAAPNLASEGFSLHSADACGIAGLPGAHLVYERDNQFVSLFSMQDLTPPDSSESVSIGRRNYQVHASESSPAVVVVWREGGVTYLICGKNGPEELIRMAELSK
jgi:anti-sigma factor RsiW